MSGSAWSSGGVSFNGRSLQHSSSPPRTDFQAGFAVSCNARDQKPRSSVGPRRTLPGRSHGSFGAFFRARTAKMKPVLRAHMVAMGAGLSNLNRGLLYRHACPLTTWGAIFVYFWQPRDDDFQSWLATLRGADWFPSSALALQARFGVPPPPAPAPRRAFFVVVAGFGRTFSTTGPGLSQRSRACYRRPSEAGHLYIRGSHL